MLGEASFGSNPPVHPLSMTNTPAMNISLFFPNFFPSIFHRISINQILDRIIVSLREDCVKWMDIHDWIAAEVIISSAAKELEQSFFEWRIQKKLQRERIPKELLNRTRELSKHLSAQEASVTIKVPVNRLISHPIAESNKNRFLELSAAPSFNSVDSIDFRKGKDDPFRGTLFVFRNKKATAIKSVIYDGQGFWLLMKRLSE